MAVLGFLFGLVCWFFWGFFFTQAYNLVSLPEKMKTVKKEQSCYWLSVFHCPSGEKTDNN